MRQRWWRLTVQRPPAVATPVTVVLTVRDGLPYLPQALASVLDPALPHPALRVVVIDDGSRDGSTEELRRWAARDDRVTLRETGPCGRGPALNLALSLVDTPYFAVLDADDVSHPERFEVAVRLLEAMPQVAAVGSRHSPVETLDATVAWDVVTEPLVSDDVTEASFLRNRLAHSSMVVRTAAARAIGGYDERLASQFDWDLQLRLASAGFRLRRTRARLVARRIHRDQSFEARGRLRYLSRGAVLQARHLRARGRWFAALTVPVLYLAYGLLPRKWRLRWR